MRMPGRRLTAVAVTAVLAATGGILATVPATAAAPAAVPATAASTTATQQEAAVRFPLNAEVVSAGTTGFLSRTNVTGTATPEYRWTRYADGTSTVLPAAALVTGGVSDVVVTGGAAEPTDNRVVTIHDMAAPSAAPVTVDFDELGPGYHFAGAIGSTLIALVDQEDGPWQPYLVTVEDGKPTARPVTGMRPESICGLNVTAYATGTAVLDCGLGMNQVRSKVVVDLATASVRATHVSDQPYRTWEASVSGTHVAWEESDGRAHWIDVARIGAAESKRIDATGRFDDTFHLLGDWLTYGEPKSIDEGVADWSGSVPPAPRPFTAESVDTGEKRTLLTHFSSAVQAPDGSLLVRGGTPEQGEALYRVSLGADGKPVTAVVAHTGLATAVTVLGSGVPAQFTGAQLTARGADMSWNLSRGDVFAWVTLRHVRTGTQLSWPVARGGGSPAPGTVRLHWNGRDLTSFDSTRPALNGAYEWELSALPDDGIGPALKTSGRFTVTRPVGAHDYNDDGSPDLLVRETDGSLVRVGTEATPAGDNLVHLGGWHVGTGWQTYDRVESVGNMAGTPVADTIARDRSGALWFYAGTGDGDKPLSARTRIGTGWQVFRHIAGGSDLTNDGKPDLLATDASGVLWLYPGTGNATAPLGPRKKAGTGWGIYNQITATGNLAGAPAGDLVARDTAGDLWLYLAKGDGTFAPRTRIGGGWGAFRDLVAVGDGNGDGRPDLLAVNSKATFYAGTGDWRAPFKPGKATGVIPADYSVDAAF